MNVADLGILLPGTALAQPWQNGRGVTRVLLDQPTWRLSIAQIEGMTRFSEFPGRDRVLMPLASGGVRIEIGDETHAVSPGEAISFRGEDSVQAAALSSQASVLNVMAVRERARITWDITRRTGPLSTGADPTVVLAGDVRVLGQSLPPGTVLLATARRRLLECSHAALARIRVCRAP